MENRIHPTSGVALLPELSLWQVPPTQDSVVQDVEHELRPISTFSAATPIRFEIKNPTNEYVAFNETYLSLKLKFTLKEGNAPVTANNWKNVKLAPNLLHSLFKHVGIEIAGKPLAHSPSLYAFKSFFQQTLGFSKTAKDGLLDCIGWEIKNLEKLTNTGTLEIDLFGVLNVDLNFQEKWLLGGTDFILELIPNPVSFYASAGPTQSLTCEFVDCSLFVKRNRVSQNLESAHEKALRVAPCRYPFVRSDVRTMTLSPGTNDYILDNVVSGVLPRRIFVSFIKASDFYTNPFNFNHFGLNHLVAYQDGVQIPTKAYTPDFSKHSTTREFVAFYRSLNQDNPDPIHPLRKSDWEARPIFGFSLDPAAGHLNNKKLGHLRLHAKFKDTQQEAIVALIYMEYDSLLEIDALRNINVSH